MLIPEGYHVIEIGRNRDPIGYKPMPDPGRLDYQPFSPPEKIWSEPLRYLKIDCIDYSITNIQWIWDDGSDEFDEIFTRIETELIEKWIG
jgi:hypothetical protein